MTDQLRRQQAHKQWADNLTLSCYAKPVLLVHRSFIEWVSVVGLHMHILDRCIKKRI